MVSQIGVVEGLDLDAGNRPLGEDFLDLLGAESHHDRRLLDTARGKRVQLVFERSQITQNGQYALGNYLGKRE